MLILCLLQSMADCMVKVVSNNAVYKDIEPQYNKDTAFCNPYNVWSARGFVYMKTDHPEVKFTTNGVPYIYFHIASESGIVERDRHYFPCLIFGEKQCNRIRFMKTGDVISIIAHWQQQKVQLDDKICPHCAGALSSRYRNYYTAVIDNFRFERKAERIPVYSSSVAPSLSQKEESETNPFED